MKNPSKSESQPNFDGNFKAKVRNEFSIIFCIAKLTLKLWLQFDFLAPPKSGILFRNVRDRISRFDRCAAFFFLVSLACDGLK